MDRYDYSFSVWPSETWGFDRSVFALFTALGTRIEMDFSEDEFEAFRSGLSHHGLTLREIERRQHADPESVY
jgi:hypothetical protein